MRKLRTSFVEELIKIAQNDEDIILLNDDTGFNLFEEFEKKFPILPNSMRHSNIDVVFNYKNGYCCAIECKFTEPYQQSRKTTSGLKEKYISEFEHWDSIPNVFQLAKIISPNDTKFNYLYSAQLVKHVLGLLTKYDKSKFRLLYVWYDAFGEKSYRYSLELEAVSYTHLTLPTN